MFELLRNLFSGTLSTAARRPAHVDFVEPAPAEAPVKPGGIYRGQVTYVGPAFAKLECKGWIAFLPISEISAVKNNTASEVLQTGQVVDFVVLEASSRVPGEWIASLTAVAEANKRLALSRLSRGDRLTAEVVKLQDNGVVLYAEGMDLFVPVPELSWEAVSHPAHAVSLGQIVEIEVTHISIPDWDARWRRMRTKAFASLRKCIPRPPSTFVPMAFIATPFRLEARARRPAHLDVLVVHVLAELAAGNMLDIIAGRTNLPATVLRAMLQLLTSEGLVDTNGVTQRGRNLVDAELLANRINDRDLVGLACNAAEEHARIMDQNGHVVDPPFSPESPAPPYPKSWPRPAFDSRADRSFFGLSGESIPEAVISATLDEQERDLAGTLLGDQRLHLRLARAGAQRAVCTYVTDHWVYAALWSAFDALGERKPYQPPAGSARATVLLLVQLRAFDADSRCVGTVYSEPYTRTLWQLRSEKAVKRLKLPETSFPDIPELSPEGLALVDGAVATRLETEEWLSVTIREKS